MTTPEELEKLTTAIEEACDASWDDGYAAGREDEKEEEEPKIREARVLLDEFIGYLGKPDDAIRFLMDCAARRDPAGFQMSALNSVSMNRDRFSNGQRELLRIFAQELQNMLGGRPGSPGITGHVITNSSGRTIGDYVVDLHKNNPIFGSV